MQHRVSARAARAALARIRAPRRHAMLHVTASGEMMNKAVLVCIRKMSVRAYASCANAFSSFVKEAQRLAIVESSVSDSISFISPVPALFPENRHMGCCNLCRRLLSRLTISFGRVASLGPNGTPDIERVLLLSAAVRAAPDLMALMARFGTKTIFEQKVPAGS